MFKILRWIPAILIMLTINYYWTLPGVAVNDMGLGREDYHVVSHFLMFSGLVLAYYFALDKKFLSFLLAVLFGTLEEINQLRVPGRSTSMFDVVVNSSGALLALLVLWTILPIIMKKLKK